MDEDRGQLLAARALQPGQQPPTIDRAELGAQRAKPCTQLITSDRPPAQGADVLPPQEHLLLRAQLGTLSPTRSPRSGIDSPKMSAPFSKRSPLTA